MALDEQIYDKCMQLWLRSLEYDEAARMAYELQIIEDLLFSVRGFAMMIAAGYIPRIVQHFEWGIREFNLSKASKISESDVVYCLCRMLAVWLLAIDSSKDIEYQKNEMAMLRKCARKLYDIMEGKEPPLLVACLRNLPVASSQSHASAASAISHSQLPLHRVVSLFLDYGCPLNSEDDSGNFLLHLAVALKEESSLECVKVLVDAGAHIDAVNYKNETPLKLASNIGSSSLGYAANRSSISSYLQTSERKHGSLRCLCAKIIIKHSIPYKNILPNFLVAFVVEHDSDAE